MAAATVLCGCTMGWRLPQGRGAVPTFLSSSTMTGLCECRQQLLQVGINQAEVRPAAGLKPCSGASGSAHAACAERMCLMLV